MVTPCIFLAMFAAQALFYVFLTVVQGSPVQPTASSFETIAKQAEEARTANRLSEAVKLYSKGVRLRPSWSEGWWSLASVLYEQDRFSEAQSAFNRFVKLTSKPGPAYAFLALCEYESKDYESALRHFEMWSKNGAPGNDALIDVAGYHWALILTRQGRFQEALYLLAAKAKKLGGSPDLAEAMGLASLRMTNLPMDYAQEERELVWLAGKAAMYAALDDRKRSNEYAARLGARYPQTANVHYFLGTLLGFQSKTIEAGKQFEEELKISPDHGPAMTELAMVHLRLFEPKEALPLAARAVELEPKNPRARYALGKSLLDTDQTAESIPVLVEAERLAPRSALVRAALANAYRLMGQREAAKREAAAFLALQDKEEALDPMPEGKSTTKKPGQRP